MLSLSDWLKTEFKRLGEKLGRNMWMIQDGDHQLCKQRLSSLIAVLDQARSDLDSVRAEFSTVPLPLQTSCSGLKSKSTQQQDRKYSQAIGNHPSCGRAPIPVRRDSGEPTDTPHAFR
jgi:hypothetical protein